MSIATIGAHPDRLDLTVHAGQPLDFTVPVLRDDGTPWDVSAWTVTVAQITATRAGTQVLHTFAPTLSAAGVTLSATAEDTAGWQQTWQAYVVPWRLILTHPDGDPVFEVTGWVRLYP